MRSGPVRRVGGEGPAGILLHGFGDTRGHVGTVSGGIGEGPAGILLHGFGDTGDM
jgi:hypothetical protein